MKKISKKPQNKIQFTFILEDKDFTNEVSFGEEVLFTTAFDHLVDQIKNLTYGQIVQHYKKLGVKIPEIQFGQEDKKTTSQPVSIIKYTSALRLLNRYGIGCEGRLLRKKSGLSEVFENAPRQATFAMKIVADTINHKTDTGAVKLNIKDLREAELTWELFREIFSSRRHEASWQGVLIQQMFYGREVIIGMKRDRVFGPVILFGLGGIYAEALSDVSMRVAPVNMRTAQEIIGEIRGYPLLKGLRGEKSVNMKSLQNIICAVSRLSLSHPEISQIDLNPVMVNSTGAKVVDVRVLN